MCFVFSRSPFRGANKKMKRAFCEPGNVAVNPPLAMAHAARRALAPVARDHRGEARARIEGAGKGDVVFCQRLEK